MAAGIWGGKGGCRNHKEVQSAMSCDWLTVEEEEGAEELEVLSGGRKGAVVNAGVDVFTGHPCKCGR